MIWVVISYFFEIGARILNNCGNLETVNVTETLKNSSSTAFSGVPSTCKLFTYVQRGQGALRFKKISGNGKITINSKTGKVTVKKKLKKGTYNINVQVMAIGNDSYRDSGWTDVTIVIKVK